MPRTTSPQMLAALEACTRKSKRDRMCVTDAAATFGVPRNSIYKHRVYLAFIAKQNGKKEPRHA